MRINWKKLHKRRRLLKSLTYNRRKFGPAIRALRKLATRIRRKNTWR